MKRHEIISEIKEDLARHYKEIEFKIDYDLQKALRLANKDENKRKRLLKLNETMKQNNTKPHGLLVKLPPCHK